MDSNDNSFLHNLVINGNLNEIKLYLKKSINYGVLDNIIDSTNNNNETPLNLAVKLNFQKIANLLIEFGASKKIKDKRGNIVKWVSDNVSKNKKQNKQNIYYGFRKI